MRQVKCDNSKATWDIRCCEHFKGHMGGQLCRRGDQDGLGTPPSPAMYPSPSQLVDGGSPTIFGLDQVDDDDDRQSSSSELTTRAQAVIERAQAAQKPFSDFVNELLDAPDLPAAATAGSGCPTLRTVLLEPPNLLLLIKKVANAEPVNASDPLDDGRALTVVQLLNTNLGREAIRAAGTREVRG